MILTKHEETKKGRLFLENEKLRIFVSSCSINYLYQVIFLLSLNKAKNENIIYSSFASYESNVRMRPERQTELAKLE